MNEPIAWLTDRKTIHFDKTDAQRDSYGFIEPLYTAPIEKNQMNETTPTLRDIFAMAALPALLKLMSADTKLVAMKAFEVADEMLAARPNH